MAALITQIQQQPGNPQGTPPGANIPQAVPLQPALKLDTKVSIPQFDGSINPEGLDSWIRALEAYFTCQPHLTQEQQITLAVVHMSEQAQFWWQTHVQSRAVAHQPAITQWDDFKAAVKSRFYPLGYLANLKKKWLHLRQQPGQSVQQYIEAFHKMSIMLAVSDDAETLLLKFIGGLFPYLQQEFDLLDVTTLDKAF